MAGLMVKTEIPTGKAVAGGAVAGGTVAAGGVSLGAGAVLVSEAIGVEVTGADRGVSLGDEVALGAGGVEVAGGGAQRLGVAVTIAMAVADGGTAVTGNAVAVTSADVGGLGVSVATTQPAHANTVINNRLPSRRRSMPPLYS